MCYIIDILCMGMGRKSKNVNKISTLGDAVKDRIKTEAEHKNMNVYFVTNVVGKTDVKDYETTNDTILTEYFTDVEFDQILSGIKTNRYNLRVFFNENELIDFVLNKKSDDAPYIVFNLARNGKGLCKKSLIPSFCETYDIAFTGSNAYMTCLGRHKFHCNCILSKNDIPVPKSWLYGESGWLLGNVPKDGEKVIAKPTYESASRGVRHTSVFTYGSGMEDIIHNLGNEFQQDIIVQEFIEGYEVQVPLAIMADKVVPIMAVGISIDSRQDLSSDIITYDRAFNNEYEFYDFSTVNIELAEKIMNAAERTSKCLGMNNYARVDFRVNRNGKFFVTDISTHPFLIRHSAFAFAFEKIGLEYKDIFAYLIDSRFPASNTQTNTACRRR